MRYKELLSLLESEYDVEVGGASGVLRSAQSDFGTFRVENAAMITRINAFIHNYLKEACLEPKQTVFGLRQKLNQFGIDFEFSNKNNVTEGAMDLKLTRFGGIFGKSDTTPFNEFDNEDGFEKIMGHGLTLKLETTIDESGLYKMEGKVIPTISETSEDVEEGVVGKAVKKVGRFIDGPDKTINRLKTVQKARAAKNLKRDAAKYASSRVDADDPKNKNHPDVKASERAYAASKSERPTFGSKKESVEDVDEAELKVITRADRAKMLADIGKTRSGLKAKAKKGRKAAKDHDGDGKIESGTDEWKGSRDKAIKNRMASRNEDVEQDKKDFKPHMMYHPESGKGYKADTFEDHLDMKEKGYVHEKPEVKESEQVDELKKSTIMNYKDKARAQITRDKYGDFGKITTKTNKRLKGVDKATKKLVAREYEKED